MIVLGEVPTYWVEILIAGDLATLRHVCRDYCFAVGLCVTITPTEYVFTGGMESGAVIRLINYPKFPSTRSKLWAHAEALAEQLLIAASQKTCSLQDPSSTRHLRNPAWDPARP